MSRVRIAFPTYNSATVANCQDMVVRAINHGFYTVWGASIGGTIDAPAWAAYKAYLTGTLAPWGQSVGLSELCIGNEVELNIDGSTLTATTVRSDIRALANTIRSNGFTGKISYSTSILDTYRTAWISEGIAGLDLIAWNSYDTLANFTTRCAVVVAAFGNQTYISEFGSQGGGYPDFGTEAGYLADTIGRITALQSAGIAVGYFFCYRDGGQGVTANSFALVKTDGTVHTARQAITGS